MKKMNYESENFPPKVFAEAKNLVGEIVFVEIGLDDETAVKGVLKKINECCLFIDLGYPELFEVPADFINSIGIFKRLKE